MSNALTIIGQQELATGGQGVNFGSKLFALKPATVSIVQRMSDVVAKGVAPGKLRIGETGDIFDSMEVALLVMPREGRDFHVGQRKSADTLMCFSRDMIKPDARAKEPQALSCSGCPKASWDKWRQTRLPQDVPPCDASYYVVLIDTVYKMPIQLWVRGASKATFEAGMQNLSRTLFKLKAQGGNPNIFDVRFKLSTELGKDGKNFVLKLSDFKGITEAEKNEFGEVYLNYVNRGANAQAVKEEAAQQAAAQDVVNSELTDTGTSDNVIEGEYIQI